MRVVFIWLALLLSHLHLRPAIAEEIIVNIDAKLPKVVTLEELREYFLLKKTYYPNGVRIQVYLLKRDSVATENFIINFLKMNPASYFDIIDGAAASGKSNLPIILDSDTRMVITIAVNRGGLGIVRDAAYASNLGNIQILEVK